MLNGASKPYMKYVYSRKRSSYDIAVGRFSAYNRH